MSPVERLTVKRFVDAFMLQHRTVERALKRTLEAVERIEKASQPGPECDLAKEILWEARVANSEGVKLLESIIRTL